MNVTLFVVLVLTALPYAANAIDLTLFNSVTFMFRSNFAIVVLRLVGLRDYPSFGRHLEKSCYFFHLLIGAAFAVSQGSDPDLLPEKSDSRQPSFGGIDAADDFSTSLSRCLKHFGIDLSHIRQP